MVTLFVTSTGQLWVGNDENVNWPNGASGTVIKSFVIDPNPALQQIGKLTGSGNASASALAWVADRVGEDPSNDPLDASGGGSKFVDIH
jgi:hypothetical protein